MAPLPLSSLVSNMTEATSTTTTGQPSTTLSSLVSTMTETASATITPQPSMTHGAPDGKLWPGVNLPATIVILLLVCLVATLGIIFVIHVLFRIRMCLHNRGYYWSGAVDYEEYVQTGRNSGNRGQYTRSSGSYPWVNSQTGARPSGYPTYLPTSPYTQNLRSVQPTPNNSPYAYMPRPKPSYEMSGTPPPVYSCEIYPPPYSLISSDRVVM